MKTKLNSGHLNLQSRILAFLIIQNGGTLKLTKEALENIKEMEIEIDPRTGEITISAQAKFVERRKERLPVTFPDRRIASVKKSLGLGSEW